MIRCDCCHSLGQRYECVQVCILVMLKADVTSLPLMIVVDQITSVDAHSEFEWLEPEGTVRIRV